MSLSDDDTVETLAGPYRVSADGPRSGRIFGRATSSERPGYLGGDRGGLPDIDTGPFRDDPPFRPPRSYALIFWIFFIVIGLAVYTTWQDHAWLRTEAVVERAVLTCFYSRHSDRIGVLGRERGHTIWPLTLPCRDPSGPARAGMYGLNVVDAYWRADVRYDAGGAAPLHKTIVVQTWYVPGPAVDSLTIWGKTKFFPPLKPGMHLTVAYSPFSAESVELSKDVSQLQDRAMTILGIVVGVTVAILCVIALLF